MTRTTGIFTFRLKYFLLALVLFATEIVIALFVRDAFIRPYVGDFLVVILLYCFVRAFFKVSVMQAALGVLAFAFLIETLQYFNIVNVLGLQHSRVARIVIGTAFSWEDMVAYALGIGVVLLLEKQKKRD